MSEQWIISDTHFSHANFLKFKDLDGNLVRPFADIDEMDELMVNNWNSVVKKGDKVRHCGDVFFGDKDRFKKLWGRLNGKKTLIVGNHDDIKFLASGGFFSAVYESRDIRALGLLFTHRPAHVSQMWDYSKDRPMRNIHGHIHEKPSPDGDYINVSVEAINYTPVNIDDLRIY